ncbi:phosphoesterase-domain-containing protein [Ramicandelaber brevisporus]|nr:phosphoesterase-domain-containing protein [Ramicandelaber brevisporus]
MRFNLASAAALAAVGLSACAIAAPSVCPPSPPPPSPPSPPGPVPSPYVPGKHFDRVFIVIFENMAYKNVTADPYFAGVAKQGLLLTNYFAVTHPSEPNYVALTYGSTANITDDAKYDIQGKSIVDLLEAKGVSWKSYQEAYPGDCFKGESSGTYRRKHNPFISFVNVQNNADLCAKIVNSDQLATDLAANTVPQYSFYTPDMNNDGHDTNTTYASKWLQGFLPKLTTNKQLMENTAVVLTFDEDDYNGTNQVYTAVLGKGVKAGSTDGNKYDHYSLLRTIEDNFELGNLGRNDANATLISSFI